MSFESYKEPNTERVSELDLELSQLQLDAESSDVLTAQQKYEVLLELGKLKLIRDKQTQFEARLQQAA